MDQSEQRRIEREEFVRHVEEQTKKDVSAMRRLHNTWALQQLLLKRERDLR